MQCTVENTSSIRGLRKMPHGKVMSLFPLTVMAVADLRVLIIDDVSFDVSLCQNFRRAGGGSARLMSEACNEP
jgi:hypothetical protein